jgi:hypothetical protein
MIKNKLLSLSIVLVLMLSAVIPSVSLAQNTYQYDSNFKILNTSIKEDSVTLNFNYISSGLNLGDVYTAYCRSVSNNSFHATENVTSGQNFVTIYELLPNHTYDCYIAINEFAPYQLTIDGKFFYTPQPKMFVATSTYRLTTQSSTRTVSISLDSQYETQLDFKYAYHSDINNGSDKVGVSCSDGRNIRKTSITGNDKNLISLQGLTSNTTYSCYGFLERDDMEVRQGSSITVSTTKPSSSLVRLASTSPNLNTITLRAENGNLGQEDGYYFKCISNRTNKLHLHSYTRSSVDTHTFTDLEENTVYTCSAGVRRFISYRNDWTDERESATTLVQTGAKPTGQVVVNRAQVLASETEVDLSVSGGNLGAEDSYYFECSDQSNRKFANSGYRAGNFIMTGFQENNRYTCVVGVLRKTGKKDSASPSFIVETRTAQVLTRQKAPFARFEDAPLEATQWDKYLNPFPDLDFRYGEAIAAAELHRRGIIEGYADGAFRGYNPVNRAEAAKFLVLGRFGKIGTYRENRFPDVIPGAWYEDFVNLCAIRGIISGYPDGKFRPEGQINRAEFIKMMVIAFDIEENIAHNWSDVKPNDWFDRYAGAAQKYSFFVSSDGTYMNPQRVMTRADVATAIYNYLSFRHIE